jgi:hypothetical protein
MAEMKEFEDLEARLRRHGLAEPPTGVGEALVEAGASLVATERRRSRWLSAAAVAVVFALNLATERYISSRTAAETPWRPPAATPTEYRDLIAALNGLAAEWPRWEALLIVAPRAPTLRAPGLRPMLPKDFSQEMER